MRHQRYFLLARWQDHVALDASFLYPASEVQRTEGSGAFIYTDRSVFRPQQTVRWKVVAYRGGGEDSRFRTWPSTGLRVTLVDANNEEVVAENVTTNGFGSASGEFEIPSGRLLGRWRLRTSLGGNTEIRVEEYKRPTFEVAVEDPAETLRLNRSAVLEGSARYYFGLPVSAGGVGWRVTREPVYPRWWYWWGYSPVSEAVIVASGTAQLRSDGGFSIGFTPEADERDAGTAGLSYRYRLTAEVTDEGGETRSASRVFRLGFVAVEARIESNHAFLVEKQPSVLTVHRTDLDGTPRAGAGALATGRPHPTRAGCSSRRRADPNRAR